MELAPTDNSLKFYHRFPARKLLAAILTLSVRTYLYLHKHSCQPIRLFAVHEVPASFEKSSSEEISPLPVHVLPLLNWVLPFETKARTVPVLPTKTIHI